MGKIKLLKYHLNKTHQVKTAMKNIISHHMHGPLVQSSFRWLEAGVATLGAI